MDLGNYELNKTNYQYTAPDPSNSAFKGLLDTDYDQLKKDLQTPGDLQINKTYDKADYRNRDIMGGGGLYGSSIYAGAINENARNRADSLASNAANVGATVAQLKSQDNQWLGGMAMDEARLKNTWNAQMDTLEKGLIHDIIIGSLGNEWALEQIDKQGGWDIQNTNTRADAAEDASLWSGLGTLAGGFLSGFSW